MNKLVAALSSLLISAASLAPAETLTKSAPANTGDQLGLGVVVGGDVGLSVYAGLDDGHFAQAAAAWGPARSYVITGDYAFAYPGKIHGAPQLTPYFGLGVAALSEGEGYWGLRNTDRTRSGLDAGLRLPLGLNMVIPRTPVQLGAELAPTLLLAPDVYSYLQGDVHARVLF